MTTELPTAKARPRTPAAPVAEHIADLCRQGLAYVDIADAATVSRRTIGRIARQPDSTVHAVTADLILGVTYADGLAHLRVTSPERRVPAIGTTRRLQALYAIGWDVQALARHCDLNRMTIHWCLNGARTTVRARIASTVADLYDRLWTGRPRGVDRQLAASTIAKNIAAARGWAPPLAWDDATIDDPEATPDWGEGAQAGATVEDIEWLLRWDTHTAATLADRLGVTANAITTALRRAGRDDLTAKLIRNTEQVA